MRVTKETMVSTVCTGPAESDASTDNGSAPWQQAYAETGNACTGRDGASADVPRVTFHCR